MDRIVSGLSESSIKVRLAAVRYLVPFLHCASTLCTVHSRVFTYFSRRFALVLICCAAHVNPFPALTCKSFVRKANHKVYCFAIFAVSWFLIDRVSSCQMSSQFVTIRATAEDEFPRSCSVEAINEGLPFEYCFRTVL